MVNFKEEIGKELKKAISELSLEEIEDILEVPQDSSKGDYAFPCFRLAKIFRKAPPMIAAEIAKKLDEVKEGTVIDHVEAVNAYVNIFVSKVALVKDTVEETICEGANFGHSNYGENRPVIVEYSSPNIAKPFHIGHIRSTVIGNALYKLYDAMGFDVIRINHLGDYGTQFGKMICAYRHWGNKEDVTKDPINTLLGYYTKFHEEAEAHPELEDEARAIFKKLEDGEPEEVELWKWFREESLKEFNRVYNMLGIEFDSYNGESFYSDKMPRFVEELREKGLLEESQGAQIVDLEPYGLGVALITKSDGSTLYITRDIAAAVYRHETYDFYKNIYVVATQQNLHFQQWIKILDLMGYDYAKDCVHVPFGMVSLEGGVLSTRKGRVVFLEDVLNKAVEKTREIIEEKNPNADKEHIDKVAEEVGIGAVVFQELSNSKIKDYVFKWDKVLNFDGETGPYVQYTHARCASVLAKAGITGFTKEELESLDYTYLTSDSAVALVKLIYTMPEIILDAGLKYEPSILTRHIVDIAQAFNRFYHDEHILTDNMDERRGKVALVLAAKTALKNGLGLLGIKAPERM